MVAALSCTATLDAVFRAAVLSVSMWATVSLTAIVWPLAANFDRPWSVPSVAAVTVALALSVAAFTTPSAPSVLAIAASALAVPLTVTALLVVIASSSAA